MKKFALVFVMLLALTLLFAACNNDDNPTPDPQGTQGQSQGAGNGTQEPAVVIKPYSFDNAIIIRPQESDDLISAAARTVNSAITTYAKKVPAFREDSARPGSREILIGETNRPETAAAKAKIAGETFAFIISRQNGNLVILGTTPEMTAQAASYFSTVLLPQNVTEDKQLGIAEDFEYIGKSGAMTLIDNGSIALEAIRCAASQQSNEMVQYINTVNKYFQDNFGRKLSFSVDTGDADAVRDPNKKEILLGATYYQESIAAMNRFNYNEYGISIEGNKVVVFGYSKECLEKAVTLLCDVLVRNTNGKTVQLPADLHIAMTDGSVKLSIPSYPSVLQSIVEVGGDAQMIYIEDATLAEFQAYGKKLEAAGLSLYEEHAIGAMSFCTYAGKKITVNCSFDSGKNVVRITVDNSDARPLNEELNEYDKVCQTQLTQVGLNYMKADTGMSYFIRLSDGRFLVIDGGSNDYDEAKRLYDLMLAQCETGTQPVIAAWFLTHAHEDHYGAFLQFVKDYANRITLENVVYNLPTAYFNKSMSSYTTMLEQAFRTVPGVETIYARTGQVFHYADVRVEVLLTPEDFYPKTINQENDTSVVYRFWCEGQSWLVLGDSVYQAAPILAGFYGSALKSDILQVAHHGYDGIDSLYRLIDPTIVLWPSPDNWFHESRRWNEVDRWIFNKYLVTSPNIKETINSGHGTTTISLPYTAQQHPVHTPVAGEIIYQEDFESMKNLYETGWYVDWSLIENRTYTYLSLATQNTDKGILMRGDADSYLAFVRPDLMQNVPVYTIDLILNVQSLGDGFSICYNNAYPIGSSDRSEYAVDRGSMRLTLVVDRNKGTTEIRKNGNVIDIVENQGNNAGSISFRSKYAEVFVGQISVYAGTPNDIK